MTLNMRNELPEEQSKSIMAFHPVTLEDRVHFNCKKKKKLDPTLKAIELEKKSVKY